jgi:hypothetical protein
MRTLITILLACWLGAAVITARAAGLLTSFGARSDAPLEPRPGPITRRRTTADLLLPSALVATGAMLLLLAFSIRDADPKPVSVALTDPVGTSVATLPGSVEEAKAPRSQPRRRATRRHARRSRPAAPARATAPVASAPVAAAPRFVAVRQAPVTPQRQPARRRPSRPAPTRTPAPAAQPSPTPAPTAIAAAPPVATPQPQPEPTRHGNGNGHGPPDHAPAHGWRRKHGG